MIKNYRILTLLLASAMLAGITSCAGGASSDDTASGESNAAAASTGTDAQKTETVWTNELEFKDYGGKEFRVLSQDAFYLPTTMTFASEENGEVVNDSLYSRDRWLEEKYNIKLSYTIDDVTPAWEVPGKLVANIMAGDDAYHMILRDMANCGRVLTANASVYPLNYIDSINLDKEYWMPEVNEQLKISGSLYFTANAISPRYYGSVYVLMFNRDMAEELKIEDMYALVSSGNWTMDKMFEIAESAVSDTDGDTKITDKDRLGFAFDLPASLVLGAGEHYVKDKNGRLTSMLEEPKLVSVMQKMVDFFQKDGIIAAMDTAYDIDAAINNGTILFCHPCTFNLADFRDLNYDYGILPMPKYDAEQAEYIGYSQPWVDVTPLIPINFVGDELEMIGTLTDAMAAYGYDYVRPAVFENVIQIKGTRDEKSAEIIDLIYENVTFDIVSTVHFGDFYYKLNDFFMDDLGKQDITSYYASIKTAVNTEMDKYLSALETLEASLK